MPFIKVQLDEAAEASPVPEGEYDLRIVKAEDRDSKKGNPMTAVMLRVEDSDYPNASPINHFILYPTKDTPAEQRQMRINDIARFLQAFDVPHTEEGFDTEDLVGCEGRSFVVQEEGEDGNIYNRLRLPRLKKE